MDDLTEKESKALGSAVKAIYFDDDADYETYLWEIVETLGGEDACDLLETDKEKAIEKYCPELNDQTKN